MMMIRTQIDQDRHSKPDAQSQVHKLPPGVSILDTKGSAAYWRKNCKRLLEPSFCPRSLYHETNWQEQSSSTVLASKLLPKSVIRSPTKNACHRNAAWPLFHQTKRHNLSGSLVQLFSAEERDWTGSSAN